MLLPQNSVVLDERPDTTVDAYVAALSEDRVHPTKLHVLHWASDVGIVIGQSLLHRGDLFPESLILVSECSGIR